MHKNEDPDFLDQVFTGKGQMTIKQMLQTVMPAEIVVLNVDAQLDRIISWNIKNQKRTNILNELAERLNLEWRRIDYRILITEKPLQKFPKASTQTSLTLGNHLALKEDNATDSVSDRKLPPPNPSDNGSSRLLAKNDSPQFLEPYSFKIMSTLSKGKNRTLNREAIELQDDSEMLESRKSELALLPYRPVNDPKKTERSSAKDKLTTNTAKRFEVTQEDETLSIAFKRWSTQEGYQLIWDAEKDFAAIQTVYPLESLEQAILHVMKDIENSDYPLHACIYKNKVLRIIPMSKVCERQRGTVRE